MSLALKAKLKIEELDCPVPQRGDKVPSLVTPADLAHLEIMEVEFVVIDLS